MEKVVEMHLLLVPWCNKKRKMRKCSEIRRLQQILNPISEVILIVATSLHSDYYK